MSVKAYMKKWSPVTRGIQEDSKGLCAWVLEREARYLSSLSSRSTGAAMKYLFPTLRYFVDTWRERSPLVQLAECVDSGPETDVAAVRRILDVSATKVVQSSIAIGRTWPEEVIPSGFVGDLAIRILESINTYPGVEG